MRMTKGGVWKNTEDEILKTAVMKYGKNEWARASTLLVRKSDRHAKARWNEWLDPSIVKTAWTREEDEKLLHSAKLMPSQWRTISPLVGRTASQCLERYERLLDAACAKDGNFEPVDDLRKLHPGEIDSNSESRPARPDPVDMDEDEIEMLSEARARLANTRGKKAKRKAREKQLEEAKRLAALHKRRELIAAGIDNGHRKRKMNDIDYNAEIPLEKKPPIGFYDATEERQTVEQPEFPTTTEELEGEKRSDKEARLRRQDAARNNIAQRHDAPLAMLQANKFNDSEAVRKRAKMNLPTPQISDYELEHIAKFGLPVLGEEFAEGSGATRSLLADCAQTPLQRAISLRTPQRTPAIKHDTIMLEAENQAKARVSQTPLLGGQKPGVYHLDFSRVTPNLREIQTANLSTTPSVTSRLGFAGVTRRIEMTPLRSGPSLGMTSKGTPIRDDLQINTDIADLRRNIRSGLTSLPQPKNKYQIILQPIPEENEEPEENMEEDMSDRIPREKAEDEAFVPPTLIEQADWMVRKELLSLLEHDNLKYLNDGKVQKEKEDAKRTDKANLSSVPLIDQFEEDELKEADHYLIKECVAMGHESEEPFDKFVEGHKTCLNDIMYFPTCSAYGLSSVAGNAEKVTALQDEFEKTRKGKDDISRKAQKIEQKINLLTNGYQHRGGNLWSQIAATFKLIDNAETELKCFKDLRSQEQLAASHRCNTLREAVQNQKELEQTLQKRYGYLLSEQKRIQNLMNDFKAKAKIQKENAANQCTLFVV